MHLLTILIVLTIAGLVRSSLPLSRGTWTERWHQALFLLLFPALLILTTAIAILYMGCHGAMLGVQVGSFGCAVSAIIIIFALGSFCQRAYLGFTSIKQLDNYQCTHFDGITAKVIDTELLYSAQIGFWQPKLVVSQGLLNTLDKDRLKAVFAHERAHLYYRDTFYFFWLGWIRSFTGWLPNTDILWQELLLLRELRADRKAAESVDFLLLAESLLTVAQSSFASSPAVCANLYEYAIGDRLEERINYLLEPPQPIEPSSWQQWSWVCLLFLPLLTIPFHY